MSSRITHKPPGPTDVYENPERIPLFTSYGFPTGYYLGAARHTPNPERPRLQVVRLPTGGVIRICWQDVVGNMVLETTPNLAPPLWQPVNADIEPGPDGLRCALLRLQENMGFYRLRAP